ncbi:hypothetical protein HZA73_06590 [candidate division TA06 bacterium]|nr:hypothetical protein [candidate division TA06 bacterium]
MKKPIIVIAAFGLFFVVLAFFIWRQHRIYQAGEQPAQTEQTIVQPASPAPADTGKTAEPEFNYARLKGDSLHLYTRPFKSDSTLETVLYKDELDNDRIQLITKNGGWYQNEDSLWFYQDEVVPFYSKEASSGE